MCKVIVKIAQMTKSESLEVPIDSVSSFISFSLSDNNVVLPFFNILNQGEHVCDRAQ